jgi:hypothetical protein
MALTSPTQFAGVKAAAAKLRGRICQPGSASPPLGRVDLGCELAGHLGDLGVADGESLELATQFL